jgi:DNA polymerase III delta subunit
MLYFFYGSDTDAAREKANKLIESLRKKKPDAELFRIDAANCSETVLRELTAGQGLFNRSYIVQTVSLFENSEAKEIFLKRLQEIAESPNIFVSLEGGVDKKTLLQVAEVAEKAQLFEKKKAEGKPEFNIFSLTNAFGKRDKKELWVLFQKAVASGAVPEEIHGILFWQLKSMLLASACATAVEAGIAPFVFTKSKNFLRNYSEEELKKLSSTFVSLYHDSHRGIHDFGIALERFILTL